MSDKKKSVVLSQVSRKTNVPTITATAADETSTPLWRFPAETKGETAIL